MSRFRVVGIVCDAHVRYTEDGEQVVTFGPAADGNPCNAEYQTEGADSFANVERQARLDGWTWRGSGNRAVHLCPEHVRIATWQA